MRCKVLWENLRLTDTLIAMKAQHVERGARYFLARASARLTNHKQDVLGVMDSTRVSNGACY